MDTEILHEELKKLEAAIVRLQEAAYQEGYRDGRRDEELLDRNAGPQ